MSETLRVLDRRWRNACKILLKEEVGQLSEFSGWLEGMIDSNRHEKSSISGKDVSLGVKEYAADARFMSFDEVDFGKKYAPAPWAAQTASGKSHHCSQTASFTWGTLSLAIQGTWSGAQT